MNILSSINNVGSLFIYMLCELYEKNLVIKMIRIGILPFLFILLPIAIYAHSSSAIKKTPYSFVVNPGPLVPPTKGAVWPEPQTNFITENFFWIKPITFEFKVRQTNITPACL